jgi:hypothetical protein
MSMTGRWRIMEMDMWDRDAIDLLEPGFIEFAGDGTGHFGFIAVRGWMDCRSTTREGRECVEFSREGNDEGDQVSGRGWATLAADGTLEGTCSSTRETLGLPGGALRRSRYPGRMNERVPVFRVPRARPAAGRASAGQGAFAVHTSDDHHPAASSTSTGNFRGDLSKLVERYYDAYLYLTS